MLRSVTSLPLPGSVQVRLRNQGFVYYEDLCGEKGKGIQNLIANVEKLIIVACLAQCVTNI
jgi:hypothetical protein